MDVGSIVFILIALAIGAVIGWIAQETRRT